MKSELPVRVYYQDTDAGGLVFYANYLKFFERGRTEWLRSIGATCTQLAQQADLMFVVCHVNINYLSPARLDDALNIVTTIEKITAVSITFLQQAWRNDGGEQKLLVSGHVKIACVDCKTLRPQVIPQLVRDSVIL